MRARGSLALTEGNRVSGLTQQATEPASRWVSPCRAGSCPRASASCGCRWRPHDGGEFAGILFAVSVGLDRAYPEMRIDAILNDAGKQMKDDIGELCAGDIISRYAFRSLSEYTTVEDPLSLQRMQRVLAINRLGQSRPTTPLYTYHAINDQLIPIKEVDELIAKYCADGVRVRYHRDPASDHNVLAGTGAPAAVAYLADRFAGKTAPSTC